MNNYFLPFLAQKKILLGILMNWPSVQILSQFGFPTLLLPVIDEPFPISI